MIAVCGADGYTASCRLFARSDGVSFDADQRWAIVPMLGVVVTRLNAWSIMEPVDLAER